MQRPLSPGLVSLSLPSGVGGEGIERSELLIFSRLIANKSFDPFTATNAML